MNVYMPDGRPAPFILTIDEAAHFLGLTNKGSRRSTVEFLRRNKIAVKKIGNTTTVALPQLVQGLNRLFGITAGEEGLWLGNLDARTARRNGHSETDRH